MANRILEIPAVLLHQPIGDFYVGGIDGADLVTISKADLRRMEETEDRYVGIQRKLSDSRVKEIARFVNSVDATFPTSVVLSVQSSCIEFDEKRSRLRLFAGVDDATGEAINFEDIARILDGQHRVEGLKSMNEEQAPFQIPVSIFVDADLADQAYIFATVNLAQTKVNKSLVYDLLDYAKAPSPQQAAHEITLALDQFPASPLHQMIKRLGTATPGRSRPETLAQATVVNALLPFLSTDPEDDRYKLARKKRIKFAPSEYRATPFRSLWLEKQEALITQILIEYFAAIQARWPDAWNSTEKGGIINRTNGFRAFMKLLKNIYLDQRPDGNGDEPVVAKGVFLRYLKKVDLEDSEFNSNEFLPGSSGESKLYNKMRVDIRL